ncbi:nitrilase-related carbon-nitrogen hydrolase [Acerihabitans arboris]|uniref:Carbon-nitrogen hydrolase n=1 Tax=Acerihabitans arboris TaxID=2691583 RepID=A0A845SMW8_9GAMM|nr:nitrilase-related carbon-nitrogen hydrolase [Acerihabitans arboris]NDL64742.1 carbon-nitrogen hydrolase [Acerihabitans arboris]
MKIGIAQITGAPAGRGGIADWVRAAMDALPDADMIMLPELALCGYDDPDRIQRMALAQGDATLQALAELAREKQQALVFGYAERGAEGLYNALRLIDRHGRVLANYRKTHLWSGYETALFRPGNRLVNVVLEGLNFGLLICYDLDFPEAARALAANGMDCLLCISATSAGYDVVPRHTVPARAYENGCYVVFANRGDTGGAFPCVGQSRLAGPDGAIVATAPSGGAAFITADISLETLSAWRLNHPYIADRRADLY